MTKKNYTEIIFVLDKSISMKTKMDATISGFNEFVKGQQEEKGQCSMTLVLFDTEYTICYVGKDIHEVEPLDVTTYVPGGNTALLDAVARAITEAGARFAKMEEDERPDNVILVMLTDGEENSSKEISKGDLAKMITHQVDKYDWNIMYLGQGIDAFCEAGAMGLRHAHANYFVGNMRKGSTGMKMGMRAASYAASSSRSAGSKRMDKSGTEAFLGDDDDNLLKQYRDGQSSTGSQS